MSDKTLKLMLRIMATGAPQVKAEAERSSSAIGKMQARLSKMSSARENLGIRSERAIQREIQRTEASYNRLARSGQMSAREQARALDATKQKVRELRREMAGVTTLQRGMQVGKTVASVGAGIAAGGYVLAQPIMRTMDYDRTLAMSANTIFSERNASGRVASTKDINSVIERAVRSGGGSRDSALQALNALVGSGAFGEGDAGRRAVFDLLPLIQKFGTGTGADSSELAQIMARAKGFGIGINDMGFALDMGLMAGNRGGMELRDQAKWLPTQMAAASKLGMSGTAGFAKLVAANQASFMTAGSTDAAGNNLLNLLAKINSSDTALDFEKKGINLNKELVAGRGRGLDAIDTFLELTDRVVGKDKRFTALQAQLEETSDKDQRRAIMESQAKIIEGSTIGQVIQDQQASTALVALLANRKFVAETAAAATGARGVGDVNHAVIASTASYQVERAKNEKEFAERAAFSGLSQVVGDVSGKLADYGQKYPALSISIVGATTALTALTAAAGAASLTSLVSGGGAGRLAAAAGAGSMARYGGGIALAGAAGYGAGTLINKGIGAATGSGDGWLGSWLFNKIHGKELAELSAPIVVPKRKAAAVDMSGKIAVTVDVKNGTASADVRMADRQTQQRFDSGRTVSAVSGSW